MKKAIGALLVLWLVLGAAVAAVAEAPVWKIVKGEHHLFIGGTIHVLSKSDYPLPAEFEKAYRQSAMMVFETDMQKLQSPEFQQRLMSMVTFTDGRTIQSVLNEGTYRRLEQHLSSRGIPMTGFERFKPGMLAVTLTLIDMQRLGLMGAGVDEFFSLRAVNDRKKLGQLESVDEQLAFLATLGDGREDELIDYTLRDIQRLPQLMASLKAAWRKGDRDKIREIAIAPIKTDFPVVYNQLLADRNKAWLPRIEAMLKTKEIEFVLVGAAHLVGEDGILKQLAARGYSIQRP